jgi:hypothetical protein
MDHAGFCHFFLLACASEMLAWEKIQMIADVILAEKVLKIEVSRCSQLLVQMR